MIAVGHGQSQARWLDLVWRAPNNSALSAHQRYPAATKRIEIMANIKSAKKRAKQAVKRREHNIELRSRFRTAMKKVIKATQQGNKESARDLFKAAVPEIDSMVTKGIIKKNRAAQYKSRLNARIKAIP
jgi:small subunit ribosomal protein S20